jgi:hypothetical protein
MYILERQSANLVGQRKHDVEVRDRQQFGFPFGQPFGAREGQD